MHFSNDLKHSHEVAAKQIVRYLHSTEDKEGIISGCCNNDIPYWDQWDLPEVERNEGDESVESLQVSEPDEMPEAPSPTQTSEPSSRPRRTRNPPDLLSPKMKGQYHGGQWLDETQCD